MQSPKHFRNYAEFEREVIRPTFRVGLTFEDMIQDNPFEAELDFDRDPFESSDEDEDEDDDDY